MADTSNRGLGSDNMDPQTKHDIQSAGGQASHSGGQQVNDAGQKGGQSSSGDGRGNFGNHDQHVQAGQQSSGHTGDPEEHARAGKLGGEK